MDEDDKMDRKDKILLEKFRIAAQIQDNYNNLFWARTGVFFAIMSALFAGYGIAATEITKHDSLPPEVTPLILILAIFGGVGALLSWLWLRIHQRATYLQDYYRFRVGVIEKSLGTKPDIFGHIYVIAAEGKKKKLSFWKKQRRGKEEGKEAPSTEKWRQEKTAELKQEYEEFGQNWENIRKRDPGSLRDKLNLVYWVFIGVWITLALLGVAIYIRIGTFLTSVYIPITSWGIYTKFLIFQSYHRKSGNAHDSRH